MHREAMSPSFPMCQAPPFWIVLGFPANLWLSRFMSCSSWIWIWLLPVRSCVNIVCDWRHVEFVYGCKCICDWSSRRASVVVPRLRVEYVRQGNVVLDIFVDNLDFVVVQIVGSVLAVDVPFIAFIEDLIYDGLPFCVSVSFEFLGRWKWDLRALLLMCVNVLILN